MDFDASGMAQPVKVVTAAAPVVAQMCRGPEN